VKKKVVKTSTLPEIPRPSSCPLRPIGTQKAMDSTRSIWSITRTKGKGLLPPRQTEKGLKTQLDKYQYIVNKPAGTNQGRNTYVKAMNKGQSDIN